MGFAGRALPILRIASLTVAVSLVGAAGVGYWFFVSQQRDYIIGRDFRILTNLTKQIDNAARAEARVIQNLPQQPHRDSIKTLPDIWSKLRGKPFDPTDITFAVNTLPKDRAVPAHAFRVNSHLMLDVPLENAGRQKLTASLNLQPGLETLFSSTVGPGAFDAILLGTRDGRVLVRCRVGAEQLRFSGLDVLSSRGPKPASPSNSKSSRKPSRWLTSPSAGSITRCSSLHAACR